MRKDVLAELGAALSTTKTSHVPRCAAQRLTSVQAAADAAYTALLRGTLETARREAPLPTFALRCALAASRRACALHSSSARRRGCCSMQSWPRRRRRKPASEEACVVAGGICTWAIDSSMTSVPCAHFGDRSLLGMKYSTRDGVCSTLRTAAEGGNRQTRNRDQGEIPRRHGPRQSLETQTAGGVAGCCE